MHHRTDCTLFPNVPSASTATLLCALLLALSPANSSATQGVDAGFDFLQSLPGTEVDLSSLGLGIISLEGVPIEPESMLGADTIVQRSAPVPAIGGTIDIEIIALSLKSVDPVDLTPLGGPFIGVLSDLYTTINVGGQVPDLPVYDPLNPSLGRMEIQHGQPQGGTFNSCFGDPGDPGTCGFLGVPGGGVYADAIFTVPGGDPNNLGDVILTTPAPRISLFTIGSVWAHCNQPPVGAGNPPGGIFGGLPCVWKIVSILENGPHPVRSVIFPVNHFKVYDVDDVDVNLPVQLVDQFNRQCVAPPSRAGDHCWSDDQCDSTPGSADGFCATSNVIAATLDYIDRIANPVNKTPELNITDPREHQVWYRLVAPNASPRSFKISIENQFGTQNWLVDNRAHWLVTPSEKDSHGPFLEPHHYLCYPAHTVTPLLPLPRQLDDQFGTEFVDVLEPKVWCNPVEKTVGITTHPVPDPDEHLACYDIQPKFDHNEPHVFTDQFGVWPLLAHDNELLCVPSTKQIDLPLVPGLRGWGVVMLGSLLLLTLLAFARGRSAHGRGRVA